MPRHPVTAMIPCPMKGAMAGTRVKIIIAKLTTFAISRPL